MDECIEVEQGVDMAAKTIEQRIEALEEAMTDTRRRQRRDDDLIKAAAGQLRRAKNAKDIDEIKQILIMVAGQLDAVGEGG